MGANDRNGVLDGINRDADRYFRRPAYPTGASLDTTHYVDVTDEVAALRAELEGYKTGNYDLHGENQALREKVEELRMVILHMCERYEADDA